MHLSLIAQTCWGRLLMQGIMPEWVQARERGAGTTAAHGEWEHVQASLCPEQKEDCFSALLPLGRQCVPGPGRSLSPGDVGNCQAGSVKSRGLFSRAFFSFVANVRAFRCIGGAIRWNQPGSLSHHVEDSGPGGSPEPAAGAA